RGVDELPGEFERQCQAAIGQVEVEFIGVAFVNAFTTPAPDLAGKPSGYILAQTKSLADFPHGTACAEARDDRGKCRPLSPVGLVDPLDHFLAPLVLEIDVDVWRLAPFGRDEALEQKLGFDRID